MIVVPPPAGKRVLRLSAGFEIRPAPNFKTGSNKNTMDNRRKPVKVARHL
jgi:hypothetical protein